jgi:hypothetical protein
LKPLYGFTEVFIIDIPFGNWKAKLGQTFTNIGDPATTFAGLDSPETLGI